MTLETHLSLASCTPLWVQYQLLQHPAAHGLLVLSQTLEELPQAYIFNADGSYGGFSGNGARIIAQVLMQQHQTNAVQFHLGTHTVKAWQEGLMIATAHPVGIIQAARLVQLPHQEKILFHYIDTGNPHALFEGHDSAEVFYARAPLIVQCIAPEGINLSMMTRLSNTLYKLMTFERGVGQTPACSSAAIALTTLLAIPDQEITIQMPGGTLYARLAANQIILKAVPPERKEKLYLRYLT